MHTEMFCAHKPVLAGTTTRLYNRAALLLMPVQPGCLKTKQKIETNKSLSILNTPR